jgi:hypothetical protein
MLQFRIGIAVVFLCAFSTASFAQSVAAPPHASHRTHTKKVPKADDSSVENWDIAAPGSSKTTDLGNGESEGRKKFFEQSTTMDNGGPGGTPAATSKPGGGFTPSMGLSF